MSGQPLTTETTTDHNNTVSSLFTELFLIGAITLLIYITYIVAFPLISNTQAGGPAADLEILMRDYRWFAPIYALGILLLYYLFWRGFQLTLRIVSPSTRSSTKDITCHVSSHTFQQLKLFILTFGVLFSFTLVWLYPITANDIFRYVLRGRVWTVYQQSPMLTPPNAFPDDPFIEFTGEFGNWVSGYGPLWEIVVQGPLQLGAINMVPGTVSLKFVVLLCYVGCAVLLGWFARLEHGTSLMALLFFAWNPLILMQGPGNGHNDLVFMMLMILGIILWQRKLWWVAALVLSLSALAKAPAALILPLFGVALLRQEKSWLQRLIKGSGAVLIGLLTAFLVYSIVANVGNSTDTFSGNSLARLTTICSQQPNPVKTVCLSILNSQPVIALYKSTFGPTIDALQGVSAMLTTRRGFAIASGVRMITREILPRHIVEPIPRTTGRYIFMLFYLWLLWQVWRNKLNLVTATFLAYFSQLMLGRTFRIWYPMWLIPLTALHLTSATFWRSTLFSLTAELSIINYFVVWRWWLRDFAWGKTGPLAPFWNYWTIMHLLTVPWLFGIPLFGPILMKKFKKKSYSIYQGVPGE